MWFNNCLLPKAASFQNQKQCLITSVPRCRPPASTLLAPCGTTTPTGCDRFVLLLEPPVTQSHASIGRVNYAHRYLTIPLDHWVHDPSKSPPVCRGARVAAAAERASAHGEDQQVRTLALLGCLVRSQTGPTHVMHTPLTLCGHAHTLHCMSTHMPHAAGCQAGSGSGSCSAGVGAGLPGQPGRDLRAAAVPGGMAGGGQGVC